MNIMEPQNLNCQFQLCEMEKIYKRNEHLNKFSDYRATISLIWHVSKQSKVISPWHGDKITLQMLVYWLEPPPSFQVIPTVSP